MTAVLLLWFVCLLFACTYGHKVPMGTFYVHYIFALFSKRLSFCTSLTESFCHFDVFTVAAAATAFTFITVTEIYRLSKEWHCYRTSNKTVCSGQRSKTETFFFLIFASLSKSGYFLFYFLFYRLYNELSHCLTRQRLFSTFFFLFLVLRCCFCWESKTNPKKTKQVISKVSTLCAKLCVCERTNLVWSYFVYHL